MRRSRNRNHPAQTTILADSGLYRNPSDDCDFELRIGGTPSETQFQNMPVIPGVPLVGVHAQIINFHNDDDIAATRWTSVKDGLAPAASLRSGSGGGVVVQSGDVDAVSYHFYHSENETVEFEQGKESWILFDIEVEQVLSSVFYYLQFGFQQNDDLWPDANPENNIMFDYTSNSLFTTTTRVDGDVAVSVFDEQDLAFLPIADDGNFHKWGIHIKPNEVDGSLFDIMFFADCQWLLTQKGVSLPTVPLHPYIGTRSHSDRITLRNIVILQED